MSTCSTGPCWTASTVNPDFTVQCGTTFNNLWLLGGVNPNNGNSLIQYSSDGIVWTTVDLGYFGGVPVSALLVNGSICMAQISFTQHALSTDGINWASATHYFGGVPATVGQGYFVLRGGVVNQSLVYSTNGAEGSWTFTDSPGMGSYFDGALIYGGGLFVGVGSAGFCYTNSLSTPLTPGVGAGSAGLLAYGNGIFVALPTGLGASNTLYRSTNGINWTTVPGGIPIPTGGFQNYYNSIIFSQDRFIAIKGDSNQLAISDDGLNWTFTTGDSLFDSAPNVGQFFIATDGNGQYIAANPFNNQSQIGVCPCSTPITYGEYWARLSNVVVSNVSIAKAQ